MAGGVLLSLSAVVSWWPWRLCSVVASEFHCPSPVDDAASLFFSLASPSLLSLCARAPNNSLALALSQTLPQSPFQLGADPTDGAFHARVPRCWLSDPGPSKPAVDTEVNARPLLGGPL